MDTAREFVKNVLDIDVDNQNEVNKYTVKAMYNVIDEEGFADVEFVLVDEFELTWEEINRTGIDQINKDISEVYGIAL